MHVIVSGEQLCLIALHNLRLNIFELLLAEGLIRFLVVICVALEQRQIAGCHAFQVRQISLRRLNRIILNVDLITNLVIS